MERLPNFKLNEVKSFKFTNDQYINLEIEYNKLNSLYYKDRSLYKDFFYILTDYLQQLNIYHSDNLFHIIINKNIFNETKHNNDRYLLYVACTRAIEHMFIFTKYIKRKTGIEYKINPWFKEIPSDLYILYTDVEFIFPAIESKNKIEIDRSVTKIINNLDEKTLYEISNMLDYNNIPKKINKLFSNYVRINVNMSLHWKHMFWINKIHLI